MAYRITLLRTSFRFRIANRIANRIKELESIVVTVDPRIRVKAEIELRSLRLLNFQKQVCFDYNSVSVLMVFSSFFSFEAKFCQ